MALQRQVLQHRGVGGLRAGGGGLARGQPHLAEQDLADLFRAAKVERVAGDAVCLQLELGHSHREIVGELAQTVRVNLDPRQFHLDQHRRHWPLKGLVDRQKMFAGQARPQVFIDPKRNVSVLGGISGRRAQRDDLEAFLRLAGPGDGLEADRLVVQQASRKLVHAVAFVQSAIKSETDQHGVFDRPHLNAVTGQYRQIVFGVLGHLEN